MQDFRANPAVLAPRARLASACAAVSASATLLGLLVAMFAQVSSGRWLPDTPDAIAQSARCEQAGSRPAHDRCLQQAAVRWDAAERQELRLASSR